MKTEKGKSPEYMPVNELIALHEARLGLTTKELATLLGYAKGNFISMLKSGAVRPPQEKIPLICKVLGIDLDYFVRCMDHEFGSSLHALIEAGSKRTPITANEERLILLLRSIAVGVDVNTDDFPQDQAELASIYKSMADKTQRDYKGELVGLMAKNRSAVGKSSRESTTPEDALKRSIE